MNTQYTSNSFTLGRLFVLSKHKQIKTDFMSSVNVDRPKYIFKHCN